MMDTGLTCTICGNKIHKYEHFLYLKPDILCEFCVMDNMEEYDPEGDIADECYGDKI